MGLSIATLAVLALLSRLNSAVKLEDTFADTGTTFESIGAAYVDDAWNISEFADKSDAFADTVSSFEYIDDPEVDNSLESSEVNQVETNKAQPDLVVRSLNTSIV